MPSDISLPEIFAVISILFGCLILASIVYTYIARRDAGLPKGSIFLGLLALALLTVPLADRFDFSFGGGKISVEKDQDKQRQELLVDSNQALLSDVEYLEETLDSLVSTTESNYSKLLSLVVDIRNTQGGVTAVQQRRLQGLVASQQDAVARQQATPPRFKVSADRLVFDKVCEKSNDTGEFYYSFLANGRPISELPLNDREPAKEGDTASLPSAGPVIIQSRGADDRFIFNGSIREYDGKSFLGRKRKITIVGDVRKEIPLVDDTFDIVFHTENSRDVCLATLTLSVTKLAD